MVRGVAAPEVDCTVVVVSKVGHSRGRGSGSGSECEVTQLIPTGTHRHETHAKSGGTEQCNIPTCSKSQPSER